PELVDRLGRGFGDVHHALVGADLVLLARLLVDVRRAEHGDPFDLRRQGNRSADLRARALGRVHDIHRRLVDDLVVVTFDPDANSLSHKRAVSIAIEPLKSSETSRDRIENSDSRAAPAQGRRTKYFIHNHSLFTAPGVYFMGRASYSKNGRYRGETAPVFLFPLTP